MSGNDWLSYEEKMSLRLNVDSVLEFGKHKGKSVREILEINPHYIIWIKEKKIHKLTPELNQLLKEKL